MDDAPPFSDLMNDPEYAPRQRRDTVSSAGLGQETCRICRSEGTPDEPLYHPCKCSGSIKFVHQECLMEWLSHSHKKHCELCKTPFRFTKLYDANMPNTLPWTVFIRRAFMHLVLLGLRAIRALIVGSVWLVALPWLVRWAWRWMFWFADAGWARDAFMRKVQQDNLPSRGQFYFDATPSPLVSAYNTLAQTWHRDSEVEGSQVVKAKEMFDAVTSTFTNTVSTSNTTNATSFWPQADVSVLSSWTYISELTPNRRANRIILDVFEGQLITCVVITGFILVFLIREWVVQQQPLVNLDNLNNEQRERERLERERERLRRQAELLDQARERLVALQEEAAAFVDERGGQDGFGGWDELNRLIDAATNGLRRGDSAGFATNALRVMKQVRAAEESPIGVSELADKVFGKLAALSPDERQAWEEVLLSEVKKSDVVKQAELSGASHTQSPLNIEQPADDASRRPPMPNREISSRATHIQRMLEETDTARQPMADNPTTVLMVGSSADSASMVSTSSTESSWQQISPRDDQSEAQEAIEHQDIFQENNDEMPITNAGPDAKINIRRSGKGKTRMIVPEPKDDSRLLTNEELTQRLNADDSAIEDRTTSIETEPDNRPFSPDASDNPRLPTENPFHPDGPALEQQDPESLGNRVANVFLEELGLDEAEELESSRQAGLGADDERYPAESSSGAAGPDQRQDVQPGLLQRLADWFWGDIEAPGAPEPALAPNEELVDEGNDAQQAAFVPAHEGLPAVAGVNPNHQNPEQDNDADVLVAAAEQAGFDAEAMEDAEELEGIFELLGLQGPLMGLLQTSCFSCVLITGTVYGAIGLPYIWGKLVLSFLGAPLTFLVKTPLQVASFIADLLVDLTLLIGGWLVIIIMLLTNLLLSAMEVWAPKLGQYNFVPWISDKATSTVATAGIRLQSTILGSHIPTGSVLGWNWAFLTASVHAHDSLKTIQYEVDTVMNYTGHAITIFVETISSGSLSLVWQRFLEVLSRFTAIPAKLLAGVEALEKYKPFWIDVIGSLRRGALTFRSSSTPMDPYLVYWNSTDRGLAVLTGYLALAALAAVYVALDTPITRSQGGRKTEKMVRDTLRQAGGVFKVILIISIEMLAFPLYCGFLLDLAFLPLFREASVATRWAFAVRSPYTFCFVHWFVGTCYMFHFALFVGMCRKILRKGVLWFIRDPDDPTFHPVRDVLERNVTTQLRKIAFSALVYGALVILCLGGVIWSIGRVFRGIFPIHWVSTEPILEFPMDLMLYNFFTPLLIKLLNPSNAVHAIYAWWLRRCARALRLSHFLFDDRRKDEEGRSVRKSWISFLLMKKANPEDTIALSHKRLTDESGMPEVYFKRDGKYVLTPCNDQYKPPRPGEAFLHTVDDDVYIADKDGKKNDHFAKIYVPPFFRLRITLFMVCLWIFSAFSGLCATLLPLVLGRYIFAQVLSADFKINDIYAYSLGAYILGGALFVLLKGSFGVKYIYEKMQAVEIKAWVDTAARYGSRALKCAYVYGFLGLIMPVIFALLLQFYFILPLHTYVIASMGPRLHAARNSGTAESGGADSAFKFLQFSPQEQQQQTVQEIPRLAEHTVHICADYALGLLYVRIAMRWILGAPASKAAEAFRRITADGYVNPNIRLATRFFVLPAILISAVVLLAPVALAELAITIADLLRTRVDLPFVLDETTRTMACRYSYPVAAGCVFLFYGVMQVANATGRWRARIRDEVYLVGERLHNFGEKKPPAGSKSVVRRDI